MNTTRPTAARAVRTPLSRLRLTLLEGLPDDRRAALPAVAGHCTVHNSITSAPEIVLRLADEE